MSDPQMTKSLNWKPEETAPVNKYLVTKREGEAGTNVCMLRIWPDGEREWIEMVGGRTTVTHHSFAAPTHWSEPL